MIKKSRLRDWVKLGLATAVERSGVGTLCRTVRTRVDGARIHVLGYHRVVERIDPTAATNPSLCITVDAFRRQMEQLRARFVLLPMSYVVRAVDGEIDLAHDAAAITFDDGYRDVLVRAEPILRELGIPATVFVPTGFAEADGRARLLPHDRLYAALWAARQQMLPLGRLGDSETTLLLSRAERVLLHQGPTAAVDELIRAATSSTVARIIELLEAQAGAPELDDGARVLGPDEVRTLADAGWEIGAHTVGHVVLTHEPAAEARRQLEASKAALERWSGRPCRYFAYCNGYHSPQLVRELRRAGYEGAVTTCDRPNRVARGDRFRISRKVLWEGHVRGPRGGFSRALSAAHLHDTFGSLGLTSPIDGEVAQPPPATNERAELPTPTEVELAY